LRAPWLTARAFPFGKSLKDEDQIAEIIIRHRLSFEIGRLMPLV
jgi:hypothetical protein